MKTLKLVKFIGIYKKQIYFLSIRNCYKWSYNYVFLEANTYEEVEKDIHLHKNSSHSVW